MEAETGGPEGRDRDPAPVRLPPKIILPAERGRGCRRAPVLSCFLLSAEAVAAPAASTAAAQDQDPQPFGAEAASTSASAAVSAVISSAAAAQDQKQKEDVASAAVSSCFTSAATSAVCSSQITHVCSSNKMITLHHMSPGLPQFHLFGKKFKQQIEVTREWCIILINQKDRNGRAKGCRPAGKTAARRET